MRDSSSNVQKHSPYTHPHTKETGMQIQGKRSRDRTTGCMVQGPRLPAARTAGNAATTLVMVDAGLPERM